MTELDLAARPADQLKRSVLMTIIALSWVGSAIAWVLMESRGISSPTLHIVSGLNIAFHPVVFVIAWKHLLPLRIVEWSLLVFASAICAACMALRLYSPEYGAAIDIRPLYLWIPVIYVFAFALSGHKHNLRVSLVVFAVFFAISLPYLLNHSDEADGNFTIQLHTVSAVLIAALFFFSSHEPRLQVAKLNLDELARLANTDELTKLANRRRVVEAIESELLRFARYGHAFSIILIDVDNFKTTNDRFGHGEGDKTLLALVDQTSAVLRDVDMLGRWGGDEFIAVLPETDFEDTLAKARELCRHVSDTVVFEDRDTTISCGVTSVVAGDTTDTLVDRADVALYASKRRGRNRAEGVVDQQAALSLTETSDA